MGISKQGVKRFLLYEARWQCSSPILAVCMWVMGEWNVVVATVIANLIGAIIMYPIDRLIFSNNQGRIRQDEKKLDAEKEI